MKRSHLLMVILAGVAVAAAVVLYFVFAGSSAEPAPEKEKELVELDIGGETSSDDAGAAEAADEVDLSAGETPGAPDPSHGHAEVPLNAPTPDMSAYTEVPQSVVDTAERLGQSWLTFDSGAMGEARTAQLAQDIPNAADWSKQRPNVHFFKDQASGNPGWRTVSTVRAAKTVPSFAVGLNGTYTVPVEISFHASFTSGGGNDRGTLTTVNVWTFHFDEQGNLTDIDEPKLK